jgi:PAS domain S-box-containing protein
MYDDKPRILIVEDESVVAMDLAQDLDRLGYQIVGIADTASEAIRLAGEVRPELVLMDIHLHGGMDGIAAARTIRDRWRIPIVFITAHSNDDTFAQAEEIKPSGYLTKPFHAHDLGAAVAVALHQDKLARELFAEKTWLATMVASLSDAVIATDEKGLVRYLSPVAESLTGWSNEEALGKPIEEIDHLAGADGEPIREGPLRTVLRTGRATTRGEFLIKSRSGREVIVEKAATPITDAHGDLIGAVSLFLDVTERREADRQRESLWAELQRSNDELSRFSHALAHDLQAPANSVNALTELVEKRGQLTDEQLHILGMIKHGAKAIERLVHSMLEIAQVGQGDLKRRPVDISRLIESLRITLAPLIAQSGATIIYGTLPVIEANPVQMERLFQNLLSNALQYRRPEVPLTILISGESMVEGWVFSMQDNGQGIPPESRERVFDPLVRLHPQSSPGSGLGLSLCRRIVERHGGRIWIEPTGAAQGAHFRFVIRKSSDTIAASGLKATLG